MPNDHAGSGSVGGLDGSRSRFTLSFSDPHLESLYQSDGVAGAVREAPLGTAASIFLWLVAGAVIPTVTLIPASVAIPASAAMALANMVGLVPLRRIRRLNDALLIVLALNIATAIVIVLLATQSGAFERYAAPAIMLQLTFAFLIARRFILTLAAAGVGVGALVAGAYAVHALDGYALDLFIVVSAVGVGIGSTYLIESGTRTAWYQRRIIELQGQELQREKERSDQLLRNVLPDAIADRLRLDPSTIADAIDDATVLFADLVGFTTIASRMEPADLVELLDALFADFDELVDGLGLEKIKTIGDAYMAAGGVPEPIEDHAGRIVELGLAMLERTAFHARRTGLPMDLRVGAHTGRVVAGVIGRRRFSYDLWGDSVNTASRMEAHGVAGAMQISRATAMRLGDRYELRSRGLIDVKGKEPMEAILVSRIATQPSP
ncbi:MAG TPA: adenylate/guanylate cyclase domain-containing protein [Candidatus Limnocylindrales bacterium]|nr:adenylate/guanylate cyclase domain-containing protein [Candidatus Limnocylindrales bacterium]